MDDHGLKIGDSVAVCGVIESFAGPPERRYAHIKIDSEAESFTLHARVETVLPLLNARLVNENDDGADDGGGDTLSLTDEGRRELDK